MFYVIAKSDILNDSRVQAQAVCDIPKMVSNIVNVFLLWRVGKQASELNKLDGINVLKVFEDFKYKKDNYKEFVETFVEYSL